MPRLKMVSAAVLRDMSGKGLAYTLVDVLPPEYFQSRHIPGAVNVCVYEVVFLERMESLCPDRSAPLVVYSASHRCMGAQDAAEKLLDAGYEDVTVCLDGLEGWAEAGCPLEGSLEPVPPSPEVLGIEQADLEVDPAGSRIEWTGRSRTGRHVGGVALSRGSLVIREGRLAAGSFTLDMTSLHNDDIQDGLLRGILVAHLSSRDFLNVAEHPEAFFETTRVLPLVCGTPGAANHDVEGQLTLRGQTRDLNFPATVERLDDGRIAVEAHFDLDRTRWGVNYGSGRFFEKLGMHLVHDLVSIQLRLESMPVA